MNNLNENKKSGVYIHVPFCLKKCAYCSFYSVSDTSRIESYIRSLIQEITLTDHPGSKIDTLYFGGGTPSILLPSQLEKIMESVRTTFSFAKDTEITLEANPGTVDLSKLRAYFALGINRINFGIQSFCDTTLKLLGRIHTVKEAETALELARTAEFENIGLDVIYGIPGQTEKMLIADIEAAVQHEPEHISSYLLSYEEGSLFYKDLMDKRLSPLPEEVSGRMIETVIETLESKGYLHYEVSNYAREKEFLSRHNSKYWDSSTYLGFGPSAHSFLSHEKRRYWNVKELNQYSDSLKEGTLPMRGFEILTTEQEKIESVFLGLRKKAGVDLSGFKKKFGVDLEKISEKKLTRFIEEGYMLKKGDTICLTPKGFRFSDHITTEIISFL